MIKEENIKIDSILKKLSKSTFRTSFYLRQKDIDYINNKTLTIIEDHAYQFVIKNLAHYNNIKDGKQTPTKNHPVFIAEHATATCCRGCLEKWHNIEKTHELSDEEIDYIVEVIMKWIKKRI